MTTSGSRWGTSRYFNHWFYLGGRLGFRCRRGRRLILIDSRRVSSAGSSPALLFGIDLRLVSLRAQAKMVFRVWVINDWSWPSVAMPEFTYGTRCLSEYTHLETRITYHRYHTGTCRRVGLCDDQWQYLLGNHNSSSAKLH
jgi:hypothetical protein